MSDKEFDVDGFLDALDELEQYGRGSGGLVGKFRFEVAFFLFTPDLDGDEKAYPFDPTDAEAREKAREDALDTLAENDIEADSGVGPHVAYLTTFYKDSAKGATAERATNWQGDRSFAVPIWADGAKEIIKPKLRELGIGPGEYWGRITFKEDPSGRTETGLDGEQKPSLVAYPAEVYEDEAAAEAAAGGGGDEVDESSTGGIPANVLKHVKADFAKNVKGGMSKKAAASVVAEEWEYSVEDVLEAVKEF